MKIIFIHGDRGRKFEIVFDHNRHEIISVDFTVRSNFARFGRLMAAFAKHGNPDLIVADDHGLLAFYAYMASKFVRSPYFIRLRGDNWDEEETKLAMMPGSRKLLFATSRLIYFALGDFALA